jgi:heat shock protein HslJ
MAPTEGIDMDRTDTATDGPLGTWQTALLGGESVPDGVISTITFTEEHRVEGNGGVNRFGGTFDLLDGEIELGPLFSTRMAGPEPAMAHESRLLSALEGRHPLSLDGDTLVIGTGAGELRFTRVADGEAAGES